MSDGSFLVTGSEGCIGSWVVKKLVERGERCVALDRATGATRLREILDEERIREVSFVSGDIVDGALLSRVVADHGVTRIIHLAALQIPFVAADPVRGAMVNVVGTTVVLDTARRFPDQIENVVYASSAAVYGQAGAERKPTTLYGVFKVCNEDSAAIFWRDHRVSSVGLRPWAVFGPGRDQGLTAAPTHAMKAAALAIPYRIPFTGRINLQYAEDVADLFIRAALAASRDAVVCNLPGSVVEMAEVVAAIEEVRPEARGLVTHGGEPLPIEADLADDDLKELVGDVPQTDLRAAVEKTIEHFAELRRAGRLDPSALLAS
ncbi:MAG: NAD(P)-dependent oxidoreductase [Actinomycetota bacterium]|nr:NAD(P)-dependent oxidoreductase [Actinomycetota bacterium]